MRLGFTLSLLMHLSALGWAIFSIQQTAQLPVPETVTISVAVLTPSEFTRMKQGDENTKNLESKAADKPSEEQSQKEAPKPVPPPPKPQAALPPPPEPEPAKPEPVKPEPEPPKAEPPKPDPPKPDPIAEKLAEPPPPEPAPPEPAPGPTPEEIAAQKAKEEAERKAAEARAKAEAERKRKEAEAKRKAEELKKKKLAEAKAKEAEKRKFDLDKLAKAIDASPDDPRALLDKSNKPTGARPQGDSQTATNTGPSAGTRDGRDTVLSAREADMLRGMLNAQLARCWRLPAGGGGTSVPVVTLGWSLKPDGTLDGEPRVVRTGDGPLFQVATEAAIRAVKTCVPFQLPPDKYANWRVITDWAFDPSKMVQ